jgi:hypothetical protein
VRQFRTPGSVRGAARKGGPYRDQLDQCVLCDSSCICGVIGAPP